MTESWHPKQSTLTLGEISLTPVLEQIWNVDFHDLFPDSPQPAHGLRLAIQGFLVQLPNHVILVDTGVGSDKTLPNAPQWSGAQHPGLIQALAQCGYQPQDIDIVVNTHLHTDHCGGNTELGTAGWTPAFPNARYLTSAAAYEAAKSQNSWVFQQSVAPLMAAGQLEFCDLNQEIAPGILPRALPGHAPGHFGLTLADQAVLAADLLHYPGQLTDPTLSCRYDSDRSQACQTRLAVLEELCDREIYFIGAHFIDQVWGKITRDGAGYRLKD